jgi:hypothetical protein
MPVMVLPLSNFPVHNQRTKELFKLQSLFRLILYTILDKTFELSAIKNSDCDTNDNGSRKEGKR